MFIPQKATTPDVDAYAVAWFPRDQIEEALERWPSLAEDLEDPDAYCRIIEVRLREVRAETGRAPSAAPMEVEALVQFASEQRLDPGTGAARSRFAAMLGSRGETVPWPPGRNEPCWCGSGRKYKRCCG
jgi:SEC-C motif.